MKKLANETKEKYEKKIEFIIDEKKTLVNQLMSVQQENDQLNECIIRVQQTEREKYLKELENYSKQQNLDYESQIADLYKKNESLTSGAKEKEGLIKNLKNDNQNLKFELKTVTEGYSSQITENNKKISFFKSENEKLLQKNSSLEDKIQDFQLKITKKDEENFYLQKNIDEMLKEFKFLKSISENKTEEISCLKENIGQMLKEIELKNEEINQINSNFLMKIKENETKILKIEQEKNQLENEKKLLEKKIQSLSDYPKNVEKFVTENEKLKKNIEYYSKNNNELVQDLQKKSKLLEESQKQALNHKKELETEILKLQAECDRLSRILNDRIEQIETERLLKEIKTLENFNKNIREELTTKENEIKRLKQDYSYDKLLSELKSFENLNFSLTEENESLKEKIKLILLN